MIFSLCARGRVNHVGFYTIPYNQARVVGVGSPNAGKHNLSCRKESYYVWDHLVRKSRWTAVGWKYLYSSSVGLHIIALILIRRYLSWFYFLWSERNIESKNLPDKVTNLGIFTIWLALSGCLPHTSSVWPWSGVPKVRLYGTFMCGLRQYERQWQPWTYGLLKFSCNLFSWLWQGSPRATLWIQTLPYWGVTQ